jgi:hypothetical protein
LDPPHVQEVEIQEESGEEMDMELLKSVRTTKEGRKTNKNRREK